jgi:hypothetical protein
VVRNLFKMLVDTPERMRQLVESYGIILKWLLKEMEHEGVDWTDLPQDYDQWWAHSNPEMNRRLL